MRSIIISLTAICTSCTIGLAQQEWDWVKKSDHATGASAFATTTDLQGNVVTTGNFYNNPISFSAVTLSNAGYGDIFIVKYDSTGKVMWARSFGGSGNEESNSVAADSKGNIYITGNFSSTSINFDAFTLYSSDLNSPYSTAEFFIAKLSPEGNVLWAKSASGNSYDEGESIAIDRFDNVIVVGDFQSASLMMETQAITNYSPQSAFMAKYDGQGNLILLKNLASNVWGSYGSMTSHGNCITIDQSDHIYMTGTSLTNGVTVDGTSLVYGKVFCAKLDLNGNLQWLRSFVGSGDYNYSFSSGIATDTEGMVYLTGAYYQTLTFGNTKLFNPSSLGNMSSIFIAKLDENGNSLWAQSATKGRGIPTSIAINKSGHVLVAGYLSLFGLNRDTLNFGDIYLQSSIQNTGRDNAFVAEYNSQGKALWAYLIESETSNDAFAIATDAYGNTFVAGRLNSNPNIPFVPGMPPIYFDNIALEQSADRNMFLAKMGACRSPEVVRKTASFCEGNSLEIKSPFDTYNFWNTGETSKSIFVKSAGIYQLSVTNKSGCVIHTEIIEVSMHRLPTSKVSASKQVLCPGGNVTLTSDPGYTYLWSTGETTQSITTNKEGIYYVTITDTNACKVTSLNVEVKKVKPFPEMVLNEDCQRLYLSPNLTANWYFNGEPFDVGKPTYEIYPSESGIYYAEVKNECETKKSSAINFKPPDVQLISLPNVITPNNDHYNENFVLDEKLSGSTLLILDRWGKEVYYSLHYQNNWNGNELSTGTYYYLINHICFKENLKGFISIVR